MNSEPSSSSLKWKYDDTFSDSTLSKSCKRKYDVFLSFRGEDTRKGFVSHLYDALNCRGVYTYKDDVRIQKGTSIAPELVKAIEESGSAIVVLSRNYASSTWCLEELLHILKCCQEKDKNYKVFPVFYYVEPTEVRKQIGKFGKGFAKNGEVIKGNKSKIEEWRKALKDISIISGWELKNEYELNEADVIKIIVKEVSTNVPPNNLSVVSKDYFGMYVPLNEVKQLLDLRSKNVLALGIWGMRGYGKTTIAQLFFELNRNKFESTCFVENVKKTLKQKGLCYIQEFLHKNLLGSSVTIQNSLAGKITLMHRLCGKKVLIVLDDVNRPRDLEFLIGDGKSRHRWFGEGSRIIITTRNKDLLETNGVDHIYEFSSMLSWALKRLTSINIHGCKISGDVIDFSIVPNLKRLCLTFCPSVRGLHESVGCLKQLVHLDLCGTDIESLPSSISSLTSLQTLDLLGSKCQLPEDIGKLKSLVTLRAGHSTAIRKLPSSVVHLSNLKKLDLCNCEGLQLPNSLSGLCSLVILDLSSCGLGDGAIPDDIGSLSSLEELRLGDNNFVSIPESISQLSQLTCLSINGCKNLRYLPKHLPFSLKIDARDCALLARYLPIWNTGEGRTISREYYNNLILDHIYRCYLFIIIWPRFEIPMGCGSRESCVKIELSTSTSASEMDGYVLCVVYEVFGLDDGYSTLIESTHVRKDFLCYFNTDQGPLKHPLEFDILISKRAGLCGLLMYIPKEWFGDQLNGASFLQASVNSMDGSHVSVKACNAQLIYMGSSTFFDYFSNVLLNPNSFIMTTLTSI